MSIKYLDKSQSTPNEVLLAGTPQTDLILNGTSKRPIANKAVYNALAGKVEKTVSDLINYYDKSQVYNKAEVRDLIGAIDTMTMEVVNALPSSDISTTTIYLLKPAGSSNYDEYVYINNEWVKIGTTSLDLSGYVTTAQLSLAIADFLTDTEIGLLLDDKQDKALSASVDIGETSVDNVEDAITEIAEIIPNSASTTNRLAALSDIDGKQDTLTFDDVPTAESDNPVKSSGIKEVTDNLDLTISNYINFAGAKNMLPCFLGDRLQYELEFNENNDGSITINGTSVGNPAYYCLAGEKEGSLNEPTLYALDDVGLNKSLQFKVKILDEGVSGVALRILFYDSTKTAITNPSTSLNYLACSTSVTLNFQTGYYSNAEYVAFAITVANNTVLDNVTLYPLIYELNEYTRNPAYFPWAMTNRDLTVDSLDHMKWSDFSEVGSVNRLLNNATTTTIANSGNPITFTVNDDKSVTVTADSYPTTVAGTSISFILNPNIYVGNGKRLRVSGSPLGGSNNEFLLRVTVANGTTSLADDYGNGRVFTTTSDYVGARIVLKNGWAITEPMTFYPMIALSAYKGPYVPYAMTNRELTDDLKTGIADIVNVYGAKNILKSDAGRWYSNPQTVNGVTFIINDDGSITVDGTATAGINYVISHTMYDEYPDGDLIISGIPVNSQFYVYLSEVQQDGTYIKDLGSTASASKTKFNKTGQSFYKTVNGILVAKNQTIDNVTVYPMIRLASIEDDTYVPYAMTNRELTEKEIVITATPTQSEQTIPYPNGFTMTNSMIVAAQYKSSSRGFNAYNPNASDYPMPYYHTNGIVINASQVAASTYTKVAIMLRKI